MLITHEPPTPSEDKQVGLRLAIICCLLMAGIAGYLLLKPLWTHRFHPSSQIATATSVLYVSPRGDDQHAGTSAAKPLFSIKHALAQARPGTLIELADGDYFEAPVTLLHGTEARPITIHGGIRAVVRGKRGKTSRVFQIHHNYITLDGFTIDGKAGSGNNKDDYQDKLVYVVGTEAGRGVKGLRIVGMNLRNAGGECVRLRYFAHDNEISDSTIENCGLYDFRFNGGGKNGEGIYIGTAPEQLQDGRSPTDDVDVSARNLIRRNHIRTRANECVDIKEGSVRNIVEYNVCEDQRDPESAGLDSRGEYNIFRYNTVRNNSGAGIRLGGDEEEDGTDNDAYENTITDNDGYALKIMRLPQGKICGNTMLRNGKGNSTETSVNPQKHCK